MQTGLHRNTISKVYRQLETDGVVEAMAGSGIYVRDQQNPREVKPPPGLTRSYENVGVVLLLCLAAPRVRPRPLLKKGCCSACPWQVFAAC